MLAGANFTPIFCEGTNGPHAGAVVTLRYGPVRFSGIAVFQRLMSPVRTGTVFPAPVRYGTPLYKRVYPYHAPPPDPYRLARARLRGTAEDTATAGPGGAGYTTGAEPAIAGARQ